MPEVTGTLSQEVKIDLPDELMIDQTARDRITELITQVDALETSDGLVANELAQLSTDLATTIRRLDTLEGRDLHDTVAGLESRLAKLEANNLDDELAALALRVTSVENRPSGGGTTDTFGENAIYVDLMPGTNDGAKIDAAWELSRTTQRPVRFSARTYTDRVGASRKKHSSLRLLGPNDSWQNPEQAASGGTAQCTIVCNSGTGAAAWLVGDKTTYNVLIKGIYFKSSNGNTQWMHHPFGAGFTCYASEYDTLSFYGFKHVMGLPTDACSLTLSTLSGEWTNVAVLGEQYSFRGSDSFFWVAGSINYGWAGANAGKYLMRFANMSKTFVKHLYLTARGGSRAILIEGPGSNQGGLFISDSVIEGQNLNDPAMGALIVQTGGGAGLSNIALNFGMARPSDFTDRADNALIMILGGTSIVNGLMVNRANVPGTTTQVDVPVISVAAGVRANISAVYGMQSFTSKPRVLGSTANLVTDGSVTVV